MSETTLCVHIRCLHDAKLQVREHEHRGADCQAEGELADDRWAAQFGEHRQHAPLAPRIEYIAHKRPGEVAAQRRYYPWSSTQRLFDFDYRSTQWRVHGRRPAEDVLSADPVVMLLLRFGL